MVRTAMTRRDEQGGELASIRETVESIWVAIILAFVLRGFLIEAFVIPTGSMAPRLMGQHFHLRCPCCGRPFDHDAGAHADADGARARRVAVRGARCPNCTYPYPADPPAYVNSGDRVLVLKYYYNFCPPRRGDVVVFKNPQDNRQNYIKRLVGLPGDRLQIVRGDLFIRRDGQDRWGVWRKPADVQEAMWQVVYDNDYPPDPQSIDRVNRRRGGHAEPPGWGPADPAWDLSRDGGRRFHFAGGPTARVPFRPGLRTFVPTYGYNTWDREKDHVDRRDVCGDLRLSVGFVPDGHDSELTLRIAAGGRTFEASVRGDGRVRLQQTDTRGDSQPRLRTVQVDPLPAGRSTPVSLAHADYGVRLWVGGRCVVDRHYDLDYELSEPPADVLPDGPAVRPEVGLAGAGGAFDLVHIRLERDVYYTRAELRSGRNYLPGPLGDYARDLAQRAARRAEAAGRRIDENQRIAEEAPGWATAKRREPMHLRKHPDNPDLDEFFVLGDNSPQSLDGRAWITASPTLRLYDEQKRPQYRLGTVPRYLLLGRALFVYWPSGYRLPGLPGLPFIPNVGRMRVIR